MNPAVHEAAHAVILIRLGGRVKSVDIIEMGSRAGVCIPLDGDYDENLPMPKWFFAARDPLWLVAGHFAERAWTGYKPRRGCFLDGSSGDFKALVRSANQTRWAESDSSNTKPRISKRDKLEARRIWNKATARLRRIVKKDDSVRLQVLAVAEALLERKRLIGDEVEKIMSTSGRAA